MKRALITGITGQDGSYLAELLLEKGYQVHGIVRTLAMADPDHRLWRIRHLLGDLVLHVASLEDFASVSRVLSQVLPHECYHLAALSYVGHSLEDDLQTLRDIRSTNWILRALREHCSDCRFYFAASSEVFGRAEESPQTERTPFHPRSSYGTSKAAGFDLTRIYRETHGLYAVSGIAYNHESPRRGFEFVTRKITSQVARIRCGRAKDLILGNLDVYRDWGHARDFVRAMWLMVQADRPDDFVIATGRASSVRDFCRLAFAHAGLEYEQYVKSDATQYRPADDSLLVGDSTRARTLLAWKPIVNLEQVIQEMVESDLSLEQSKNV
ncbi:MAG: GDP-mannose 4,6-dehydratase [Nitrospirae bacterium]|nr:MAG: GDP-mannose 4,6-dehydratase [Nitrospirota bacterium]